MDIILILDFGSQTTQLIGRRIRDLGVYAEIIPGDSSLESLDRLDKGQVRGLILSGSPCSVYDPDSPRPDPLLLSLDLPVLGICYGAQRLMHDQGGAVEALPKREFGRAAVRTLMSCPLLEGVPDGFLSWMSHGDTILTPAPGYRVVASTENDLPAVIAHSDKAIYGLQFHPEVTHSEYGDKVLENFVVRICAAAKQWSVETYLRSISETVIRTVG